MVRFDLQVAGCGQVSVFPALNNTDQSDGGKAHIKNKHSCGLQAKQENQKTEILDNSRDSSSVFGSSALGSQGVV